MESDVSPDPTDDQVGPLYLATKLNLVECTKILLRFKASVVAKSEGETPLEAAVRLGNVDVLQVLFAHIRTLEKDTWSGDIDVIPLILGDVSDDEEKEIAVVEKSISRKSRKQRHSPRKKRRRKK